MKNKMKNKTKDMKNSYDKKDNSYESDTTKNCGYRKDCHTERTK